MTLTQIPPVEHIKDTTRGSDYYVRSLCLQFLHLISDIGAPDASMAGGTHVVTQSQNHFLNLGEG